MASDWGYRMQNHDQFEELCALAAGGELGYDDLRTLKAHLDECYRCRELLSELSEIHAQWLPEGREIEIERGPACDAALRRRILKRAASAGAHFSRFALKPADRTISLAAWRSPRLWAVATAAMLLVAVGGWVSVQILRLRTQPAIVLATRVPAPPPVFIAVPEVPANQADQRAAELSKTTQDLEARQAELETALERQQQRAASFDHASADAAQTIAGLKQQLQDAETARAGLESELAEIKAAHTTDDAVTLLQQQEISRLNKQLSQEHTAIDREQQMLSSGREIRDLIAARNLHIIDVYDTDAHGKTGPAFGRVFFTEGKSLIFYAYDLGDRRREKGDIAFYVWGKKDGAPQDVRKLGALVRDAKARQRWVFTLTDPKVLAEIDSVFVTLEPGDKAENRPRGKRVLSAFLGSPANHP